MRTRRTDFSKNRTETEYEVKGTLQGAVRTGGTGNQKEREASDAPILVAIDGRCGSGKTTLGEYLGQVFDCNVFRMDDFFLRMEQRTPERMAETGGNVDYERFEETVLTPVLRKKCVSYQPFSCQSWGLMDAYEIPYWKSISAPHFLKHLPGGPDGEY